MINERTAAASTTAVDDEFLYCAFESMAKIKIFAFPVFGKRVRHAIERLITFDLRVNHFQCEIYIRFNGAATLFWQRCVAAL